MTMLMALALMAVQAEQPEPVSIPSAEAVQQMHRAAQCIVRERTGEVRAILAMDYRTDAYRRRLMNLGGSGNPCFERWIAMNGVLLAGSLAEELYLRDHRAADPAALVASARLEERSRTEAMANCVVRRSPAPARAVLDTEAASAAEGTALDALRPAIAACLQGADEARMNRPGLRALIALSLYHAGRLQTAER
jgi:hypothetical protein